MNSMVSDMMMGILTWTSYLVHLQENIDVVFVTSMGLLSTFLLASWIFRIMNRACNEISFKSDPLSPVSAESSLESESESEENVPREYFLRSMRDLRPSESKTTAV